jgi:hypothetical protein
MPILLDLHYIGTFIDGELHHLMSECQYFQKLIDL